MAEIKTATGGVLTAILATPPGRIDLNGKPVYVVTFEGLVPNDQEQVWRASLSSWVLAAEDADRSTLRRRAARRLVTFGLSISDAIIHLSLSPSFKPLPPPATGLEFYYACESKLAGLVRAARVATHLAEVACGPRIDRSLSEQASNALRRLTIDLHDALAMPENADAFGK